MDTYLVFGCTFTQFPASRSHINQISKFEFQSLIINFFFDFENTVEVVIHTTRGLPLVQFGTGSFQELAHRFDGFFSFMLKQHSDTIMNCFCTDEATQV